jgi:hypothetical protein
LPINFGPIGTALLWLPFYLVGHAAALVLERWNPAFVANGVSAPYIYAICLGSVVYGWSGIYLSYRLASRYSDQWLALGAALVILFATNAVYYMYVAPAFSHATSLFASALFACVWWQTRAARARGAWTPWLALGASGGLMTMVREQEAVLFILPLVEGLFLTYATLRKETPCAELTRWLAGGGLMVAAAFVVFIPQLIVYRVLNGDFLPARNVTEKFTWDGRHIFDILFSNFHGLLTWTPVVLLALVGLLFLWRRDKLLAAAFFAAFVVESYLLGSFSTWFGGAAFGMRRFVNCTVIFVVGLAALAAAVRARVPGAALVGVGALLIVWNLFFIIQFVTGMVPREQPVDLVAMASNQVLVVPPRLVEIVQRFLTNRSSFYNR